MSLEQNKSQVGQEIKGVAMQLKPRKSSDLCVEGVSVRAGHLF